MPCPLSLEESYNELMALSDAEFMAFMDEAEKAPIVMVPKEREEANAARTTAPLPAVIESGMMIRLQYNPEAVFSSMDGKNWTQFVETRDHDGKKILVHPSNPLLVERSEGRQAATLNEAKS